MATINKKNILSIFIIIVFCVFVYFLLNNGVSNNISEGISTKKQVEVVNYIKIGDKIVKIERATTREEQEKGLSMRESIADGEGMLFIFPNPDKYSFWMKDMNFPIDIVWIDEILRVVYIEKNAQPSSYPNTFMPTEKAMYVLEVISGFSEKNNLKVGNKVEFLP